MDTQSCSYKWQFIKELNNLGRYNQFYSSSVLNRVDTILRGKMPPPPIIPEPEPEPEPEIDSRDGYTFCFYLVYPSFIETHYPRYAAFGYLDGRNPYPTYFLDNTVHLCYQPNKSGSLYVPPKEFYSEADFAGYSQDVRVCSKYLMDKWEPIFEIYKTLYFDDIGGSLSRPDSRQHEGITKSIFGVDFTGFDYRKHDMDFYTKYRFRSNVILPDTRVGYCDLDDDGNLHFMSLVSNWFDDLSFVDYSVPCKPLVEVCQQVGYDPFKYVGFNYVVVCPLLFCEASEEEMGQWSDEVSSYVKGLDSSIDIIIKYDKYSIVW